MLAIMRMVVVLPEPLGPMKPYTEPSGTVSDRSSTAVTAPKDFVTCEIWTASIDPQIVAGCVGRNLPIRGAVYPRLLSILLLLAGIASLRASDPPAAPTTGSSGED